MKTIKVLWTGGWDSTYRLVELSRKAVEIQPVYIIDSGRKSRDIEISTMTKITASLRERKETLATIKDVELFKIEDIPEDAEITRAFEKLSSEVRLGSQYEWIARLAKINPGLEIGIEKPSGEYSGCMTVIDRFGRLLKSDDSFVIDPDNSSKELLLVFGNLLYPICHISEVEMVQNIKSWGYEDIMKMIWFCHSPLKGEPCGFCRPCQQKMECNMEWLLPQKA